MPANLEVRGKTFYFRKKIKGEVHRISTGFKVGGRRAQELAQRRAVEIENEIRAEARGYVKKDAPFFPTWASEFIAAYYPDKDDAYNTEAQLLIRPSVRWKERRLDTITRTDIELYFRERESFGAKGGTRERERVLLKRLFRAAVDDGLIPKNPMAGIRAFKTTPKTRVLSRDEEALLRGAISPEWQRWLTVALTTGLRLGELMMLRPCDVRDGWIHVRPESNKTRTARMVPLRPETRGALAYQAHVRPGDDKTPYWGQCKGAIQMTLRRTAKKLEIPPVGPHDMRRTFATRCAQAKMYPKHLQLILGHKDISTTMKFYVHEEQQSLADALSEVTL